jgi:hypothetical protein
MPSVLMLQGTDAPKRKAKKMAKKTYKLDKDGCRPIRNPKTGCVIRFCKVDKKVSRTGWQFRGPAKCPAGR